MPDRLPCPDTGDDAGTPRWVKVSGIVVAVLVLLLGIVLLSGHGPGRHFPGGNAPPSGVTGDALTKPAPAGSAPR